MSNYKLSVINPKTKKREEASFLDNYFGKHEYGIEFSDGEVYRYDEILTKNNGEKNKK